MKKKDIEIAESLAKKFRLYNGMSQVEAINLKSLLRKLNILTLFRPLSENFYGMSLLSGSGMKFILVNSKNPKGRQHFTIAHELYHLFLDEDPKPHICKQDGAKDTVESKADAFAAALLMPEEGLMGFISNQELKAKKVHLSTIIKMEQYFSVSRTALLYRLNNCKLISNDDVPSLLRIPVIESAKQYGYDTALYKEGNEGLTIGDFGEKARLLYEEGVISEGHYQELLNLIPDAKS